MPRRFLLALSCLVWIWVLACVRPAPQTPPPEPVSPPEPVAPAEPLPPEPSTESPQEPPPSDPSTPADAPESSTVPTPAVPAEPTGPIVLRVGLETDLKEVVIPCCLDGRMLLEGGDRRFRVRGRLTVTPDGLSTGTGYFRLQVAALRDEVQAHDLAARLTSRTGQPADAHFDAGVGLYRVRLGKYASREQAETAQRGLEGRGVPAAFVVSEGADLSRAAVQVMPAGGSTPVRLDGRWVRLVPDSGFVHWDSRRFRGTLLLYVNDRGTLNVVNELPLEDYLRSVVPSEMGPEIYDRPEALKAQAVAARTYVLRHLGEFRREGYDVCATPRCQVYRGAASEHPVSDRAVEETAQEVLLHDGVIVDARYSATCGGHTEDVAVVFPLERHTYLRGVPCPEAGPTSLAGSGSAGDFAAALGRALVPTRERDPRARLAARLDAVARRAGLSPPRDRLRSLERTEVRRHVAALLDLLLDPAILQRPTELPRLAAAPPRGWSPETVVRVRRLADTGLFSPGSDPLSADEADALVLGLAETLGLLRREHAWFLAVEPGGVAVRTRTETRRILPTPPDLVTARPDAAGRLETAGLDLVPGDRLTLVLDGERLLGLVQEVDPAERSYRRRSGHTSWTRFRSDAVLARQVAERYPGVRFAGLDVLDRGVSGRVGKIRIRNADGGSVDVEGLAVRWTLDVPDTRFQARRTTARDGRSGWLFTGSGWGHGVGMCQVGSVNLAGRGATYQEILHHYYTGVELARVRSVPDRWIGDGLAKPSARTR